MKTEIVIAGVLNKIEIWPKERYDSQLEAVLSGKDAEMNLAKLTEEAFALLDDAKEAGSEHSKFFAVGRGLPNAPHEGTDAMIEREVEYDSSPSLDHGG